MAQPAATQTEPIEDELWIEGGNESRSSSIWEPSTAPDNAASEISKDQDGDVIMRDCFMDEQIEAIGEMIDSREDRAKSKHFNFGST